MTRAQRWTAGVLGTLVLASLVVIGAVLWWMPSEARLATRLQDEFSQRLGIPLTVGRVHWTLLPEPIVVVEDIATRQAQPITVRRVTLRPQLGALWDRRIAMNEVEIEGAVLPRASVREFRGHGDDAGAPAGEWVLAPLPVERLHFHDVTWIDRRDIALAYEGLIEFDAGWRPHLVDVQRMNVSPPARLRAERQGKADRWLVLIDVGGGMWNGTATLDEKRAGNGAAANFVLKAELAPDNVDLAQLLAAFQRRSAVHGKLSGRTELEASGTDPFAMIRSLHTRTRFSVHPATVLRFDLAKAVATAGLERDGQTPLDELTGTLDTQQTDDGVRLRYSGLHARSGVLTATGGARVFNRKLDGEVAVDLVDGVVGVPLKLGGTLDKPELSLTGGALAGAAVGSAVLPGVGTVIGARIGQKVEQLFGAKAKTKPPSRARSAPRSQRTP